MVNFYCKKGLSLVRIGLARHISKKQRSKEPKNQFRVVFVSVFMFALLLNRTITLLLVATLLSSQLIAFVPSHCGCADLENESRSCCSDTSSSHADKSSCCADKGVCCCGPACGDPSSESACGCSAESIPEQAPNEAENRVRLGADQVATPVSSVFGATLRVNGILSNAVASQPCHQISTQILHCVWQV